MSIRTQLCVGALLLLGGALLMIYTVRSLYGMPALCAVVMLWLALVEYAVGRSWWLDAVDYAEIRRNRP